MASATSLNPDAPAYVPLSFSFLPRPPVMTITPSFLPPAFSASSVGFRSFFLPLPALPPHPTPPPPMVAPIAVKRELAESSSVPPRLAMITERNDAAVMALAPIALTRELAESAVPPRWAIAERNDGGLGRRMIRARRESGRGKAGFGFGGNGKQPRRGQRGGSPMHEQKRSDREESWAYAGKYQSVALRKEEEETTVMIKNIPYEYTPVKLMEFMDQFCKSENKKRRQGRRNEAEPKPISAYDFLYLPMDFSTKMNKGYAFVNFTVPEAAWKFFTAFDGTRWDLHGTSKTRKVVRARLQGKEALLEHFRKSIFECESDEYLPLSFTPARDGSGSMVQLTVVGNRGPKSGAFAL